MKSSPEITPEALLAHSDWVRRLVMGLVMDPGRAEDVLQETWLVALEHPPKVDRDLRAWLVVVARNTIRNFARGEGRRKRREEVAARVDALPDTVDVIAKARMQGRMVEAVLALDEPYRTTVLLRYFEELAPREIAKRLGRPVNTVHTHIARGLERLRGELDAEYGDREAWGLAFLPLLHRGSVPAAHGSLLLKAGGWIMLMKWMLPIAAGIVALVAWTGLGDGDSATEVLSESRRDVVALVDDPKPEAAQGDEGLSASRREDLAGDGASSNAEVKPADLVTYAGRVVDVEGRALRGFELQVENPDRPQRRGNRMKVGSAKVTLPEDFAEHLDEMPAFLESAYPGLEVTEDLLAVIAGEVIEPTPMVTDEAGVYSVDLPFAKGELQLSDPGYCIIGQGANLDPRAEREPVIVVARVEALHGRVVDQSGGAVPSARLDSILQLKGIHGFPLTLEDNWDSWSRSTTADEGGAFRFDVFPVVPGLVLSAQAEGYESFGKRIDAESRPYLEIVLNPEQGLTRVGGRVLDLNGQPAEGAKVFFDYYSSETDSQGRFEMPLKYIPTDEPLIAALRGFEPAIVEDLGERLREDAEGARELTLHLGAPTRSIRGRVFDEGGEPLAGVEVFLLATMPAGSSTRAVEESLSSRESRDWGKTDAQGRFEIDGLFQESYDLIAFARSAKLAAGADGVAPGTHDLEIVLDRGTHLPKLKGRVVDRRGAGVSGAKLLSTLTTSKTRGGDFSTSTAWELGETAEDGSFELRDIPVGSLGFSVRGTGIESTEVDLSNRKAGPLEIAVPLKFRFQLEPGACIGGDNLEIVDEGGEALMFVTLSPGATSHMMNYWMKGVETLPTFEVSDLASEVVVSSQGVVLRRISIVGRRGEVVRLR